MFDFGMAPIAFTQRGHYYLSIYLFIYLFIYLLFLYYILYHYVLPPFSLIRDFGKQNTRGNVSKISVSLACY